MPRKIRPTSRARWHIRVLIAAALWLPIAFGCSASNPPPAPVPTRTAQQSVEVLLRSEVETWLGTPYRIGGVGRKGIDCSGLVQQVYGRALGVDLPRTSEEQLGRGRMIEAEELQPGDLVAFRTARAEYHVGIYLGRGEFAHASSHEGVVVASLSDSYWQQVYLTARRILKQR